MNRAYNYIEILGWALRNGRFHPKTPTAHTSAPPLVSIQDLEAGTIPRVAPWPDFFFILQRSNGYIYSIFGWSMAAPPQVAYNGNI